MRTAQQLWKQKVRRLARQKHAVILAHNYQVPEIQDIAHYVGDSLALAREAARTDAAVIVFCGVHFMAETAKILSPDRKVLLPDLNAGCSLADSVTVEDLRAWKAQHPDAVVVSYVNTTARIKALTDYCCTSSNAVDIVASIPAERDILFLPDQFLGAHVKRITARQNIHVWMGECHVHAGIDGQTLSEQVQANPEAELFIHPECGCATSALYLAGAGAVPAERVKVLSTGGMIEAAARTTSHKVLVATETGLLHQLHQINPHTEFAPVNPRAQCRYMKMITPEKLLRSLQDDVYEIVVDPDTAGRARLAVERMIAIGNSRAGAE